MSTTAACGAKPAPPASRKTIRVNGVVIPRAAIAQETQHHPAPRPLDAMKAASVALVVRELLLQEARRLGIPADPASDGEGRRETEEEALIRGLVEREVQTPAADEAACRRFYEQNRRQFRSPDLHEVRHILLPANEPDRAEVAAAILARLAVAPGEFGELALAHSACPSGRTDGSLGQIGPGQTVPEFEEALARMSVGAIHSEPVETRYGLHIVALDRRIEGRDLPFDIVRGKIAAWLEEKVRRTAIRQYIQILAGRAEIDGIDLAAAGSPLVQ
ncbi:peptidylprolyl isomerase [Sediminicoccus rosea]|uniref:Parvulin-like PPIase n=1 Tax=Sediminicoccus rosea TaxID=1225128 RepID=A0ABZ0PN40_9PROT|nr:peptidylprolyl isomerase [Sediminicoccus rosea]WPB87154.1 peptidylprolyl isomerase [Sediminicoccus rosea]